MAIARASPARRTSIGPGQRESFSARGPVAGRKFDAHHAMLPSGEVAWSLVEDTGQVLREAQHALTREHERAEFLLEASSVLMASLNIDRCREATVQLRLGIWRTLPSSSRPPAVAGGCRSFTATRPARWSSAASMPIRLGGRFERGIAGIPAGSLALDRRRDAAGLADPDRVFPGRWVR